MYEPGELDRVVPVAEFPPCDTGAPSPVIAATEGHVQLAYVCRPREAGDVEAIAVVSFDAIAHLSGLPNDETLHGHPLYGRGLNFYGAFRVEDSSWIEALERTNSVHARHDRRRFLEGLNHYILAFHDSTFECVARDFAVRTEPVDNPLILSVQVVV